MAGTDPYDRITEGVSSGLKFALEQRKLDNEEASINERLEAARIAKQNHAVDVFAKVADVAEKTSKMNPKMQQATLKAITPQLQSLGIDINELTKAQLTDPNVVPLMSDLAQAFKLKMTEKDTDAEAMALLPYIGKYELEAKMKELQENRTKLDVAKLASSNKLDLEQQRAEEQRQRDALKHKYKMEEQGAKLGAKKEKESKSDINGLRKEVAAIDKEYSDNEQTYVTLKEIGTDLTRLDKNPQLQRGVLRLGEGMSEKRKSVVNESEVQQVAGAASAFDRIDSWIKNKKQGEFMPKSVTRDIINMAPIFQKISNRQKAERLDAVNSSIKSFGLEKSARAILGQKNMVFFPEYADQLKKITPVEQTKKSLPVMSDDNIRKNIVAAYRRNGITPTEAQIKAKIQLYKQKSGAK